jgi:hypothetical protein
MKKYRVLAVAVFSLVAALSLFGCDSSDSPSGSELIVTEWTMENTTPDLSCPLDSYYGEVTLKNVSLPNAPADKPTNSRVQMTRYRVDFVGLNRTVEIPSINGAGLRLTIEPDGEGTMSIIVMDSATMQYIRNNYPSIGNPDPLTLRADITMWGEDAFGKDLWVSLSPNLVVDNYGGCAPAIVTPPVP